MCKGFYSVFNKHYQDNFSDLDAGDVDFYSSVLEDIVKVLEIYKKEYPFVIKTIENINNQNKKLNSHAG